MKLTAAADKKRGVAVENRSPAEIMRENGLDPHKHMTPLQFLMAVVNNDVESVYKSEKKRAEIDAKGGFGIGSRIECARTAVRYFHQERAPEKVADQADSGFAQQMADALAGGNHRISMREVIVENAYKTSPDMPLPDASYPPAFDPNPTVEREAVPSQGGQALTPEYELPPAEGVTDYDPDLD